MSPTRLMPTVAAFYASHSVHSSPGALAAHYSDLPDDPAALARIARNLLIHRVEGPLFGYDIPTDRLHNDAETRYIDDILQLILDRDPAPLTRPRELGARFVGVCRDFALLLCSFLRHKGIPARVRSGFADYFEPVGFHWDHMVTEYWDDGRGWLLADPELADPLVTEHFKVTFDPMDVPRERFLVAGEAWRAIRTGRHDATRFGLLLPDGPLVGKLFVAGNVRLDLAALDKVEALLWDLWGVRAETDDEMTGEVIQLFDRAAELTSGGVDSDQARELISGDDRLRVPETVLSDAPFNGPATVTLRT